MGTIRESTLNLRPKGVQTFMLIFRSRHLLRLWLRNEELAWSLPEALKPNWKRLFYSVTPEQQRFPLDPEIRMVAKGGVKY